MNQVYRLHGFPGSIVSDRDPVFTSHFWQELFKYAGTGLRMSSANHPQTDGQTERVNQCLETFLHCFTQACPRRWSYWIPLAQFWYNSSHHSAIGMSPFRAMYGHEPRQWGITSTTACSVPALRSWLDERVVVQDLLQQHLHRARQCMKQQADKKRSFRAFEVGNSVYLKLQPYIQTSVASRACHKLAFRFFGPFKIIGRVNEVAYKLQLPPQAQVHPVVSSQLILTYLQCQWQSLNVAGANGAGLWWNKCWSGDPTQQQWLIHGRTKWLCKLDSQPLKLGDKLLLKKGGMSAHLTWRPRHAATPTARPRHQDCRGLARATLE